MSNTTILRTRGSWSRTSSALSSCSSSSTNRTLVEESSHRYCTWLAHRWGKCRWTRRPLTTRPGPPTPIQQRCWPGWRRCRLSAKPRLIKPTGDFTHGVGGLVPGPTAPQAQMLLAQPDIGAALLHGVPEHGGHGFARHHDVGVGLNAAQVPESVILSYLQVFFFFQRRSPRTPSSFMPR